MDNKIYSDSFDSAIEVFLTNIESLWKTLPTVLKTIDNHYETATNKHNKFLETNGIYSPEDNLYTIQPENSRKFKIFKKDVENSRVASVIIKRNFVVSLISQFDTYIGSLIKCIFLVRPDLINNSEKQLTYSQLRTFNNIDDAKEFIIEKEIETVLRESHTEQFRWFEKKLNINLLKDLPIWPTFIELTQRRNLFVHTNGIVSTQYINVCTENKVSMPKSISIGDVLDVDIDYFERAFVCLFEIGLKLNQVLRRNLLPDNIENADKSFLNISFELIQNNQYTLAKEIYDFADKYIKKYSNNDLALRIKLNRAQTYKWLDENEKCIDIVNSIDWSASGDLFKLASFVLRDDYLNAATTMRNIGDNSKVLEKSAYNDWPIFKEFKKTTEFKSAFKEIYSHEHIIEEETVLQSQ
ncbi:MAG: hypothetical protein ACRYFB_06040 [Janthinobacterium lividum]